MSVAAQSVTTHTTRVYPRNVPQHDANLAKLHGHFVRLVERYAEASDRLAALRVSRQLRRIAEYPGLPDPGLRALYLTLAEDWSALANERRRD